MIFLISFSKESNSYISLNFWEPNGFGLVIRPKKWKITIAKDMGPIVDSKSLIREAQPT